MGQKVNPHGLRVGVIKDWDSRWYAREEKVGDLIVEDYKIREYLKKALYSAGVPTIEIERDSSKVRVYIHCARPGVVIGKGGQEIERLRQEVEKLIGKPVALSIVEVRTPDTNAQLVAENIAQQLEKRIGFRRAMKNAMGRAMRMGARSSAAAVWAAPRSPEASATTRVPFLCRPSVPTSTTALPRRTRPTDASASRSGSIKARFFPRPFAPLRARWIFPSRRVSADAVTTAAAVTAVRAVTTVTTAVRARAASAVRAMAADPQARAVTTAGRARLPRLRKEATTNVNA